MTESITSEMKAMIRLHHLRSAIRCSFHSFLCGFRRTVYINFHSDFHFYCTSAIPADDNLAKPFRWWFSSPQTIVTNWHYISQTTKYCNIISIVYRFTLKYITSFFADIHRNCSSAGLSDNSFWTLQMTKSITSQMKLIIWPQYSWKAIHCNTFSFGYSFHLKIYIKYISRYLFELSDSNPFWRHFFHSFKCWDG